jgi:polyadenylate-binding protein
MSEEKTENLFIGGFPVQTTAEELRAYFSGYKSVQSVRIVNNPKGESKGFGFISLSDPNEVDSIIRTVHKIHGKMVRFS